MKQPHQRQVVLLKLATASSIRVRTGMCLLFACKCQRCHIEEPSEVGIRFHVVGPLTAKLRSLIAVRGCVEPAIIHRRFTMNSWARARETPAGSSGHVTVTSTFKSPPRIPPPDVFAARLWMQQQSTIFPLCLAVNCDSAIVP